jgi:hypothetical protein
MNNELNIHNNPNDVLKQIAEYHGIDLVKEFIKSFDKAQRKKQIRVNGYVEIANKVYRLMEHENYSKTRAIDKVALDNHITHHTVRNHCAKLDKEAKEFDYYSFGKLIDDIEMFTEEYQSQIISNLSSMNGITSDDGEVYYMKYQQDKKKNKNMVIDTEKFKTGYYSHVLDFVPF